MKTKHQMLLRAGFLLALAGGGGPLGFSQAKEPAATEPVTVLEKFIISESANATAATLLPTARPVDSLYGFSRELIDTPRSVTVITPEALAQRAITNVNELVALVPGATVINYYGVPGIPTTHGLFTSIYFNGMQRVWNRNGYPTSFGSLESMDFVKGPAPATYSAAGPGGFVNFLPKSPYYDKYRGSLRFSYGSHQEFNTQVDVGGPFLLGSKPAAFRISVTNQQADSYYQGIKNDYVSLYGALKARLSDSVSIYAGGEFYRHRSKENPGWNRVTQNLIDHDEYLVGAPLNDLTAPTLTLTLPSGQVFTWVNDTPGFVSRPALETATPFGGTRGQFGGSFLAMNGFSGSGFSTAKTAASADALYLYTYLGAINNPTGKTVKLDGGRVLTDAGDFTNADTYLFFFDTVFSPSNNLKVTNKFFIDAYTREKLSSYGYGELGKNFTVENKIMVEQRLPAFGGLNLVYGVSARYEDSLAKTEFTVEPFSRRDISAAPTLNDTLKSGRQRGNTGRTYWDPFGSWDTQLLTAGVFLTPEIKFSDAFSVLLSARWDNASWKRAVPFGLAADFNSGPKPGGGTSYTNYSVSPVLKLSPDVTLYATAQKGTSFQGFYVSGSVDQGDTNFQESSIAEVGVKASLLDKKLFTAVDVFYQELVNFDQRGGATVPQRGKGVEFEATWVVSPRLSVTANATWQQHFFRSDTIPGGFVPLTEADYLKYAALFYADFGGRPNPGGPRFGIPEYTAGVFVKYDFGNGFGINGGPSYTTSVWGNPDKTLKLPDYTLWNAAIYYATQKWQVQLSGKNLFSARYFNPYDAFSANAMILKGEPLQVTGTFTYKF